MIELNMVFLRHILKKLRKHCYQPILRHFFTLPNVEESMSNRRFRCKGN